MTKYETFYTVTQLLCMNFSFQTFTSSINVPMFGDLTSVAIHLMKLTSGGIFNLSVCRSDVLGSTFTGINRIAFAPNKRLQVCDNIQVSHNAYLFI